MFTSSRENRASMNNINSTLKRFYKSLHLAAFDHRTHAIRSMTASATENLYSILNMTNSNVAQQCLPALAVLGHSA